MKIRLRKLFAAAMAFTAAVTLMLLTACGEDKPDYEALKTDIIGVWCDIDGPEFIEDGEKSHYRMYEFTDDGRIIYHMPDINKVSIFYEEPYEIRDDLFDSNGAMCRISIENDILTMSFDGGSSQYRRMDIPEMYEYGLICMNNDLFAQLQEYAAQQQAAEEEAASGSDGADNAAE